MYKKNILIPISYSGRHITQLENAKHINPNYLKNYYRARNRVNFGAIIIAVILAISVIGIISSRSAFAAASNGNLTPDTDKIIGSVQDDGSITFSTCNLVNTSDKLITLETATVSVAEEAKSVSAINTCELTINSFDGCVYKGMPNGEEHEVSGCSSLDVGQSTPFALAVANLDKQSALDLCGKKVFTLNLTPMPSFVYSLETDGNGS